MRRLGVCVCGWVVYGVLLSLAAPVAHADETVTLGQRTFADASPAAPFGQFFADARRLAAATTPAWTTSESDLSAWGPALIFPFLGSGVPNETVLALAAPLEAEATAPVVMFRTLGLYAAKGRLPSLETPTLMAAVRRNLRTIERATSDLEAFTSAPQLAGWGSIGAGAWLAYLQLLYRDYFALEDADAAHWNRDGLRIVEQLIERGQLPEGGFRSDPRDERMTLWPTALAIHALVKAYENEELVKYESAAIATAAAVDSLRAGDGSYFSTAERTDTNPSANAFLAGGFLLLFKDTGDPRYRDRAIAIVRWLTGGAGAAALAREAGLSLHAAYLALLLDSLATQQYENLLGRRPMQATAAGGDTQAPATGVAEMAARLRAPDFRYRALLDGVLATLVEHVPRVGGHFAYDYGDSPGYAASVLLAADDTEIAPRIVERERNLLSWPHVRDLDEISFGAAALVAGLDHPAVVDAGATERSLRRYVFLSGGLAFLDRYYLDWLDWWSNGGGFDYGPTVVGAQIATTQLRFAQRFPGQAIGWFVRPNEIGTALVDGATRAAWDGDRHIYRARPKSDAVQLLPNAMMIISLLHAQQVTGDNSYLQRAEEVVEGLAVLWDDARGAYFASSDRTGDDGYLSLSSNSYAALALLRLESATREEAYRERALRVFDFIAHDLYANGIIYHHLFRGRRASGDIWCTGCNWRVLGALVELAKLAE